MLVDTPQLLLLPLGTIDGLDGGRTSMTILAGNIISGGRAQRQKDYGLDDFCKITNYVV